MAKSAGCRTASACIQKMYSMENKKNGIKTLFTIENEKVLNSELLSKDSRRSPAERSEASDAGGTLRSEDASQNSMGAGLSQAASPKKTKRQ